MSSFTLSQLPQSHPSQQEVSRVAAHRYAELDAVAQRRAGRRSRTRVAVRRLRHAAARYLVATARVVDAR